MAKPPVSGQALPVQSPLKQVNQQGAPKRSKLDSCWHDLSHNPTLFTSPSATPPPKRYFSEFFCLNPSRAAQEKALAALSNADLLGAYKVRRDRVGARPAVLSSNEPAFTFARSHHHHDGDDTDPRTYARTGSRTTSRFCSSMPSGP